MKVLKYPIAVIVLFLALGIIADNAFSFPGTVAFTITIVCVIAFAVSYYISKKQLSQKSHFLITTCLLSFSIGLVSHWLHYDLNCNNHYSHLITDEVSVIQGVVSERLKPNDYYEKHYFEVESIDNKAASGRILLSVPKDSVSKHITSGDIIIIADTPQPIYKPLNPYQFDYSAYMEKQNVFHQLRLKGNYIKAGQEKNFDYYINSLRKSLIHSFDIHKYSPEVKNIINALLLGQRQDMDKETTDAYTKAGVIHILAISGLHFATLFVILNMLLHPLRRIGKKGKLWQLLLVLGVLWTFAFITGLSASVVRSVVMFSFVGIGRYFNRNSNIFNSIAVSMLVLLLAKPNFLFDVGFQLSYAAVFAIVWLQPFYSRIRTSKYKAVNYFTDTVVISLVAQIGVLPLSLYYFNQFPLLFLLANIIVIPLSTLILLIGIVVLVLNYTIPSVALLAGEALEFLIVAMNRFIEWISSFEKLVIKDIPFSLLLNISLYVVIISGVLWLYRKDYKRSIAVLASVIVFHLLYTVTAFHAKHGSELIVFNDRKNTSVAIKNETLITVYSTDSLAKENSIIRSYSKGKFNRELVTLPLKNTLFYNKYKILIIDSLGIYPPNAKPDIIVLVNSPKINLDRTLNELKPKQIVADATNYKSYIKRWEVTCMSKQIPFHATTEKGFYGMEK